MAFPTSLVDLDSTRGSAGQKLNNPNHVTHHTAEDDVIEALQAKVGIDSSAVTTSHDYKLSEVTGSDKAVGKTATQTLTNKTLTAPVISTIVNTGTLTLPTSTDTLVGRATTDTLTNKTLTAAVIATSLDLNGTELILDADADTSITSDTDDQVDFRIAGADDFRMVANIFRSLSGSVIETDTINETTAASGVTVDSLLIKDSKLATNNSVVTANITDDAVTDDKLDYPRFWQELGRASLGSEADIITVSSLPVRKYLKILFNILDNGSAITAFLRFNADSGSNYSSRRSQNGAADGTATSQTSIIIEDTSSASDRFGYIHVFNVATQEKLALGYATAQGTAGAANLPTRSETNGKWANATDAITSVSIVNGGAGNYQVGSEIVVLGHD